MGGVSPPNSESRPRSKPSLLSSQSGRLNSLVAMPAASSSPRKACGEIADNNADLWDGSLDNALGLDENGAAATGNSGRVLTGTFPDGTESDETQYFGNPTQVRNGSLSSTGGLWMRVFTENPNGGASSQAVYAMSEVLTVPVP